MQADGKKISGDEALGDIRSSLNALMTGRTQGKRPEVGPTEAKAKDSKKAYLYSLLGALTRCSYNCVALPCCSPAQAASSLCEVQHAAGGAVSGDAQLAVSCKTLRRGSADHYIRNDVKSITESIVSHVEYTLARNRYSFDTLEAYQATAYSLRDRLIQSWNDTQQYFKCVLVLCCIGKAALSSQQSAHPSLLSLQSVPVHCQLLSFCRAVT